MPKKSLILLSGGLDSLVNFKKAYDETQIDLILTFDYGQKSAEREIEAARSIAVSYQLNHQVITLDWLEKLDTGLTKGDIPEYEAEKLDDLDYASRRAEAVWVPNRNGVMINIAAAYADKRDIDYIVVGFNKEEGATFPDNTPEYMSRVTEALKYSTLKRPEVISYTVDMDKRRIVEWGREIRAPFEYLWSCYHGREKMCGRCESCRRLIRALDENKFCDEFEKINRRGFEKL